MARKQKKTSVRKNVATESVHTKKFIITRIKDRIQANSSIIKVVVFLLLVSIFSLLGLFRLNVVTLSGERHITVVGTFYGREENKVARFTATVTETNVNKELAVDAVNKKTANLVEAVKNFGVDPQDIKTTNYMVYRYDDTRYLPNNRTQTEQVWHASNSIDIEYRNIAKSGELASLITGLENTEIYGPTYSLDYKALDEARMMTEAVNDAKEKAGFIANNQNMRVGKIISIEESGISNVYPYSQVLGSSSAESSDQFSPGMSDIEKKVTVKFSLK